MKIDEKTFAALCFLILMNHHGQGCKEAHPNYIREKISMLDMGLNAFALLDSPNKKSVGEHLRKYGYEIPEIIANNLRVEEQFYEKLRCEESAI